MTDLSALVKLQGSYESVVALWAEMSPNGLQDGSDQTSNTTVYKRPIHLDPRNVYYFRL